MQGPSLEELNEQLKGEEITLPASPAEIPDFLYKRGTKSYDIAYTIIFQGAKEPKEIGQRLSVSPKTVYNVKAKIKQVMDKMSDAQRKNSGTPPGKSRELLGKYSGQSRQYNTIAGKFTRR